MSTDNPSPAASDADGEPGAGHLPPDEFQAAVAAVAAHLDSRIATLRDVELGDTWPEGGHSSEYAVGPGRGVADAAL